MGHDVISGDSEVEMGAGSSDSVSALITELGASGVRDRRLAAERLGTSGDERALEALVALALADDTAAGDAAVMAVGRIGGGAALAVLQAMMPGGEQSRRVPHGSAGPSSTEERGRFAALSALIADRDPIVRRAACVACSQIEDPRMLGLLVSALHDEAPDVRCAAAKGLGAVRGPVAAESLAQALDDADASVREAAAAALGRPGYERAPEG